MYPTIPAAPPPAAPPLAANDDDDKSEVGLSGSGNTLHGFEHR